MGSTCVASTRRGAFVLVWQGNRKEQTSWTDEVILVASREIKKNSE